MLLIDYRQGTAPYGAVIKRVIGGGGDTPQTPQMSGAYQSDTIGQVGTWKIDNGVLYLIGNYSSNTIWNGPFAISTDNTKVLNPALRDAVIEYGINNIKELRLYGIYQWADKVNNSWESQMTYKNPEDGQIYYMEGLKKIYSDSMLYNLSQQLFQLIPNLEVVEGFSGCYLCPSTEFVSDVANYTELLFIGSTPKLYKIAETQGITVYLDQKTPAYKGVYRNQQTDGLDYVITTDGKLVLYGYGGTSSQQYFDGPFRQDMRTAERNMQLHKDVLAFGIDKIHTIMICGAIALRNSGTAMYTPWQPSDDDGMKHKFTNVKTISLGGMRNMQLATDFFGGLAGVENLYDSPVAQLQAQLWSTVSERPATLNVKALQQSIKDQLTRDGIVWTEVKDY